MEIDPVAENVRLAVACGAEPAAALAVALVTARPRSADEAFALLDERRDELRRLIAEPTPLRQLAPVEPEIDFQPPPARLRLDIGDHELRGRLLFGDILNKKSFLQATAWLVAGLDLSPSDADLLGQAGVMMFYADPQIWPFAVARRAAVHGAGLAGSLIAALATVCTPNLAAEAIAGFQAFLDRVDAEVASGRTVEEVVAGLIAARERIPGVRRPVTDSDERVPHLLATLERYGRADGPSVRLMHRLGAAFEAQKGLRLNVAAPMGAMFRDLGFTPRATAAFTMTYFIVPLAANVAFVDERALLGEER